jgi:hypothetical protein
MSKKGLLGVGVAVLLVALTMGATTAIAGSVALGQLQDRSAEALVTKKLDDAESTAVLLPEGFGGLYGKADLSGNAMLLRDSAGESALADVSPGPGGSITIGSDGAGSGGDSASRFGSVRGVDIPVPTALVLLSSAVLGLVTVGRLGR